MGTGIFAGITWAMETVVMGIALTTPSFISTPQAIFLAPFISTFLHDAFSAIYMFLYNTIKGNLKNLFKVFKNGCFKWLVVSSAIGGPIGMTGYMLAVNYMGSSIGAVASAIYPAIGTALACIFLKEKVKWYQWLFLLCTLIGVYGLSYSPNLEIENFWFGLLGVLMCAFGWGIEAVILAKFLKDNTIKNEYVLNIRQTVSALIYGTIILPLLGGWDLTLSLFTKSMSMPLITIAVAAFWATVSYMLYYKAIGKIGASKAMALNITYTAWAIVFTFLLLQDLSLLDPLTIVCTVIIVVCGVLAATDFEGLRNKKVDKIL